MRCRVPPPQERRGRALRRYGGASKARCLQRGNGRRHTKRLIITLRRSFTTGTSVRFRSSFALCW